MIVSFALIPWVFTMLTVLVATGHAHVAYWLVAAAVWLAAEAAS